MARADDRRETGRAQPVHRDARDESGSPASSAAKRATLRLSSPAWFAQPSQTSSISSACDARALDRGSERERREVVGPDPRQPAAVAADGRPNRGEDDGAGHVVLALVDHALRDGEGAVGRGHTAVDGALEEHLADLVRREPVSQGGADVHLELVLAPRATSAVSVIMLRVRRSRPGRDQTSPHA